MVAARWQQEIGPNDLIGKASMSSIRSRTLLQSHWLVFATLVLGWCLGTPSFATAANWPAWRGPYGTGVALEGNPPITWSEQENIRWKVEIPGKGHSTPIVWGDLVFLTTAIPFGPQLTPQPETAPGAHDNATVTQRHRFATLAIDRRTGNTLWQKDLHEALPHEGAHFSASQASQSPVTDGTRLFAYFGSYGLYCLDFKGELQWSVELGEMQTKHGHGEGSSLAIYENTLIVNWDHEGQSFIVAFDARDGKQKWRVPRSEVTSWSTPIVVEDPKGGPSQVIVCGSDRVRGYDISNGQVIWECGGMSQNIVATPVSANGMVFVGSSYDIRSMLAIKLAGARGDITNSKHVAWTRNERTPYVPSPLLFDGALYFLRHYQGILTRVDAATGNEPTGPFRLGPLRDIYASPVSAAGRIYFTDLDGTTLVLSAGEIPRPLSTNRLDDSFSASAAIANDEIFLRGNKFLYCIAKEPE